MPILKNKKSISTSPINPTYLLPLFPEIARHLENPRDIAALAFVNKNAKELIFDNTFFWKKMFQQYFPFRIPSNYSFSEFRKAYQIEYKNVSKTIFSLAKRGDFQGLYNKKLALEDFLSNDINDMTPLEWLARGNHFAILNYLYKRFEISKELSLSSAMLLWRIKTYQPIETIKSLFESEIFKAAHPNELIYQILMLAASVGHTEMVELCLQQPNNIHNSAINIHHSDVQPIHHACKKGHLAIVKLLLANDPNILNKVDTQHQTPLIFAAAYGHSDIVSYLAEQGADLTLKSKNFSIIATHYTALHWACQNGHLDVVRILIDRKAPLTFQPSEGVRLSALHVACRYGHLDIVKLLLTTDNNLLNILDVYDHTPLIHAIADGHEEVVRYLIAQGADLRSLSKENALHRAAGTGNCQIIKILIDNGVPVDSVSPSFVTPLIIAAQNGHLAAVKLLLSFNPDIDHAQLATNQTALHFAAENGHMAIARLLIKHKANPFKVNVCEDTATDIANKKNNDMLTMKLLTFSRRFKLFPDTKTERASRHPHRKITNEEMLLPVKALKKVMFDGAPKSSLKEYKKELKHSEFKPLYKRYK